MNSDRRDELLNRRSKLKAQISDLDDELRSLKAKLNRLEDELWDIDNPEKATHDYHRDDQRRDDEFFDEEYR